ncbi:keratin, type I cytoskeletal 9-like, partial [Penaeus japonicus]|uniref:keratin, type I cytoskeletal 9-like n=1 Tax=Penaeus japonicus TaxID=27405 RepID=UPI001C710FF2
NSLKFTLSLALLAACATADTRSHAHGGFSGHVGPSRGVAHGHGGSFVSGHGASAGFSHGGSFGRGVGGHGGSVVVGHSVSTGPVYGGGHGAVHGGSIGGGHGVIHGGSVGGGHAVFRPSVSTSNIHGSSFPGHGVHGASVSRPHTSFSSGFSSGHGGVRRVVGHHGSPSYGRH